MSKTIKITNDTGGSITIKMNTEGILSDMGPPIGKQGHINVNVSDASYCEFWVYSCTSGGQSRQLVLSSNDLLKHKEVVIRTSAATVSSVTASDHASGSTSEEHQPRSTSTPGAGGEGDIEVGGNRKLAGSSK
ncbi:uncharacterized protein [Physcomitrium patens]|uniref:uncharacterized protein isoform X2 n=1 Tax=Physcomitrium patens TaxID=3218 RepID=UPI00024B19C7|nr:uncharacterized protein LOC112292858 isoform X2 [Physcomitrium patens]|eukprot:XP_024397538.1 uncharacterized protein LOC112292858 isoform X2 [Physcomitrella patens]